MQEPITIDVSLVNGNGSGVPHGLPSVSPDPPSAGFTAVNGTKSSSFTTFRADDAARHANPSIESGSTAGTTPGTAQYHGHGWRPADGNHSQTRHESYHREGPNTGKRKRIDQVNFQGSDYSQLNAPPDDRQDSPKRRLTTLDSAVDLTSPENSSQPHALDPSDSESSEAAQMGTYEREKTPVERWNQGDPPPKPRPETEASLAASLHQFQRQNQQSQDAPYARSTSPHDVSPPEEADDIPESQGHSDDPYHGDIIDPKRRKRNFSNRTKTGCHTCRSRKKKCDEGKPYCQNCERGGFECAGYGPKPPGGVKTASQSRAVVPLQSKTPMAPYNGRASDAPNPAEEGRSYSHWGRVPVPEPEPPRQLVPVAPADPRRPSTADTWQKSAYPVQEPQHSYQPDRLPPPPTFAPIPPIQSPFNHDPRQPPPQHPAQQAPQMQQYPPPQQHTPLPQPPPPRPPSQSHHPPPPPPPPMPLEPWGHPPMTGPYQHQNGPPSMISSRDSVHSGSHQSGRFPMAYSGGISQVEKNKMLRGQPFLHYLDQALLADRQACKQVLEHYNNAAEMNSGISTHERAKLFTQILKPHKRANGKSREHGHQSGPVGSVGDHTIVESPFRCEYGYNIHIGKDCIIESGSYFQDAADIFVGSRVMIGHNVKLYCITASIDPSARKGSQGNVVAGAIKIDDDCFIGADAVILPWVTICRGAVVGAGSVVTKDVEENTVVAGNPAKLIRRIEGSNIGRHHSQQIQRQQDKMQHWMVDYANSGFSLYTSPRL